MTKVISSLSILLFMCSSLMAQEAHKALRQGDSYYTSGDYAIAEEAYRKAVEKESTLKTQYNLGNTLYQQQRLEEAVSQYEAASQKSGTNLEKANAYYNLGNSLVNSQEFEKAAEAYKQSIMLNPDDEDARRNLYLSKLMEQKQQEQQQEQEQENNEQQDQQDQNQEQSQDQESQEQQDQQESDQEQQQSDESQIGDEEDKAQEQEAQEMTKEDAEKLLQVIENEEKKVQEKLRKVSGSKNKPKKDW